MSYPTYWSKTAMIPVSLFTAGNSLMIELNPWDSENHAIAVLTYSSSTKLSPAIYKTGWGAETFKVKVMGQY